MSSIRHDGRVLSARKRHARTLARTCVRANFAASARAAPSRSFASCACAYARTVAGIHHCATNFRDKYFTDGHYAGTRVFARYKLWMIAATAARRPRGGTRIVSTEGPSTSGDAIGRKGKSLMPGKFARCVLNDSIFVKPRTAGARQCNVHRAQNGWPPPPPSSRTVIFTLSHSSGHRENTANAISHTLSSSASKDTGH